MTRFGRSTRAALAFALLGGVLATSASSAPTAAAAPPTDLFFSEYIEGSSFNKVIEIYNGTGSPVDLSAYSLELYSNGAATASQSTTLSGMLADGDVFVAAHGSASAGILAVADVTDSSVINFNGDDAVVLRRGGAVVDVIGQVGFDPGSQWGSDEQSTQDNTIRRMASVCAGDTDETDVFDPAVEWDGFAQDTFDGVGAHVADCVDGVTPSDLSRQNFLVQIAAVQACSGGAPGASAARPVLIQLRRSHYVSIMAKDMVPPQLVPSTQSTVFSGMDTVTVLLSMLCEAERRVSFVCCRAQVCIWLYTVEGSWSGSSP
jgi:predicted extracellular nuclease